jgi:hypothetical protein
LILATPPNVTVAFTAEDRGVSAAINSLSTQLKQLAVQQTQVASSAAEVTTAEESMAASMHEARGAAALLGEETGVKLNRHLRGVLASSETLGPILAAAFPIAAAIGFAEVIVHAAEKMSEFISDLLIYTEDQKKAVELEKAFNAELIRHIDTMARLNKEYERMGKNAVQIANLDVRDLNTALDAANKRLEDARKLLTAPLPEAGFLAQAKAAVGGFLRGGYGGALAAAATTGMAEAQAARELEVKKDKDAVDEITAQRRNAEKNLAIVAQEARDKEDKAREAAIEKALNEYLRYFEAQQRLADEQKKLAEEVADFWASQQEKTIVADAKAFSTRLNADIKFQDATKANRERAAIDAISLQQREVEQRAGRRELTGAQELAQLQTLAKQKLDLENAYLDERIAEINTRLVTDDAETYAKDLEEYTTLLEQKRAAQDRFNAETASASDLAAKHLTILQTAQKSIAQNIGSFFTQGITQARSFGDAFANLAKSIISDLQKMAAEFVITALKKQLLGEEGGGEDGGGEGGGGVGGFLGGILGALKFAGGGEVTGPGGPKADLIPAMLSSGEFVLSADAVKAIGTANLQALNMATNVPHLASGGAPTGDISTSSEISMGIGLDEGLILRHLGSKAAGRVILQQLANNPKGASRALSRTD